MKRRDLLKVVPASVGFGFVLGWVTLGWLTPKPVLWMLAIDGYVMNLSWNLQHLSNSESRMWLLLFALIPLVLLVVSVVSVIGFGRIVEESNLQYMGTITADKDDLATDTRLVIGHKALKKLPAGKQIHMADIQ